MMRHTNWDGKRHPTNTANAQHHGEKEGEMCRDAAAVGDSTQRQVP